MVKIGWVWCKQKAYPKTPFVKMLANYICEKKWQPSSV